MRIIKNNIYYVVTFFLSFFIMALAFINVEMYPFGNNQIMVIDSWHQYYPFLQELHRKLIETESLFYTWNTGGGSNFLLIMAYYAISPLYLISVFFPREYLREFMLLATILKIAFAGTFFSYYLGKRFKSHDLSLVFFGLLYAFCGYAMGYYWNIMWLDAMALLPLVVLGLHRVLDGEGFLLYAVTLGMILISNFYIGYFVCIFLFLYFFALYYEKFSFAHLVHLAKTIGKVAIVSLLGIGLSAMVMLPTFRGLAISSAGSGVPPDTVNVYFHMLEMLNSMLINAPLAVRGGMPNIYSGLLTIILVSLFFVAKPVNSRAKIGAFTLITLFILSFNFNYLNYWWHGFRFPNEIPYRFAFLFSFLLITWAYQGYLHLDDTPPKVLWVIGGIFLGYLLIAEQIHGDLADFKMFYLNMLFLALYIGILLLYKYAKMDRSIFTIAIGIVLITEVTLSGINGTAAVGSSGRTDYPLNYEEVQLILSDMRDMDDHAYRVEMNRWYSVNDPALYGYHGITQFSSTANANVSRFAQKLGLAAAAEANAYLYAGGTPVVDGLFALKYIIERPQSVQSLRSTFTQVGQYSQMNLYKSTDDLPWGFMVDETILDWELNSLDPFENQEAFVHLASGLDEPVYREVPLAEENYINMEITEMEGVRFHYRLIDSSNVSNATLIYRTTETGNHYLYGFTFRNHNSNVIIDGETASFETRKGMLIDLGPLEAGKEIRVSFEPEAVGDGYFDFSLVAFDRTVFSEAREIFIAEPFEVSRFDATKVGGTIDVLWDGVLYLSIPYEKGWTAKINGAVTETVPIGGAMTGIPLTAGSYVIELSYRPEGFLPGLGITLLSILAIVGQKVYIKKRDAKNAESEQTEKPLEQVSDPPPNAGTEIEAGTGEADN